MENQRIFHDIFFREQRVKFAKRILSRSLLVPYFHVYCIR